MKVETDGTVEGIAIEMLNQLGALRRLVTNLSETIVGMNAILATHSKAFALHQRTIEVIASELGIAFDVADPEAPQSPPPLN